MGQKVNPHGMRVGVIKDWDSRWYARDEKVGDLIVEDNKIRKFVKKSLYGAGVPKIEIERSNDVVTLFVHCARPGMVIGKDGAEVEKLRLAVEALIGKKVKLNIVEIAGVEHYHEGTIPLQTIRADIEYGFAEAATTFGRIGVKVWIYKGEVLTQTLRTTPRTLDTTKPYEERRERRPRRDGDRRPRRDGQGGYQRREGGFNRNGNRPQGDRPQGGYRKPAENKEGGAQ